MMEADFEEKGNDFRSISCCFDHILDHFQLIRIRNLINHRYDKVSFLIKLLFQAGSQAVLSHPSSAPTTLQMSRPLSNAVGV